MGRLSPEKGVDVLLRAFALVAADVPDATLAVIGDGRERPALEALARELGVAGRVEFLGRRENIEAQLGALGLFVLPSRTEGMPMALLEAMAARLPIVATNVGGIPEAVHDGVSGLLVPSEDPRAMAAAMRRILTDDALADRLAEAARARFLARYELSRMVAAYEECMQLAEAR